MSVAVADFPQVWEKPPFTELLRCLKELRVHPPVWNPTTPRRDIVEDYRNSAQSRREVAAYLSSIIRSELEWIEDDDEKEVLWTEASRRLSERCGRAGMGEITRRWPFESRTGSSFELIIREPPIVGDCLGLKTWGSSYVLAQSLDEIALKSLSHVFRSDYKGAPVNVLELGSGTGLLGMAAAALWKTSVVLTDLPDIMPNLAFNVESNRRTIESLGGSAETGALTWGGTGEDDSERFSKKNQFQVGINKSANEKDARAILVVPLRDSTAKKLLHKFRSAAARGPRPLICLEEHSLTGQDDWGDDEEASQVECWWGVFGE
ncbi:hypothetical protein DL771_007721 [Monosporascus sp. 5C6A]|nr:hypothetical protein DL771_007721 [Monosporascus sp. 5C6A]